MMRWWVMAVLLVLEAGCSSAPDLSPMSPRPVREVDSWTIARQASPVGRVRLLEISDPEGTIRFYRVENLAGQWLGYIDASGRVYKYEPFERREQFCGVYSMHEGVAHLFDDGLPVEIVGGPGTAAANAQKTP